MLKNVFKKYLVIGIIILFVGASVLPVIGTKELNGMYPALKVTLVKSNSRIIEVSDWCCECDIWVPDNYSTIQEAIDAAEVGDCICVRNGTYYENVKIEGADKNGITLCGEDKNNTIIDGQKNNDTVIIKNTDNIIVTGFTIQNSSHEWRLVDDMKSYKFQGISIDYSDSCNIYDNIIYDNGNGVRIYESADFSIENNQVLFNLDNGLRISTDSSGWVLRNNISKNGLNEVNNNGDGIEIHKGVWALSISCNIIECNRIDGIWNDDGDGHKIIGNTISDNGNMGIHSSTSDDCIISENEISNNDKHGIYIWGLSSRNTITHNNITDNNENGIYLLLASNNNTISSNNILNNNENGIYLKNSLSNPISSNNITDNNENGIYLLASNSNTISSNNILNNNENGIYLLTSNSNTISSNNILDNKVGIKLESTNGNTINHNTIINNEMYGIYAITARFDHIKCNQIEGNHIVELFATGLSIVIAWCNWWGPGSPYHEIDTIFSIVLFWFLFCKNPECSNFPCNYLCSNKGDLTNNIPLSDVENNCNCS